MNEKHSLIFKKYGFNFARCFGSKSNYRSMYPNNLIIFNARIYLKETYLAHFVEIKDFFEGRDYEIWYGDLDLSKDIFNLYQVQLSIGKPIVITTEHGNKILEIG